MKRVLILVFTIFIFSSSFSQWYWNNPSLGLGFMNDIANADEDTWWTVGDNGLAFYSVDGGENWSQHYLGTDNNFQSICFVNEEYGWIASENGKVFFTTDKGVHWDVVFVGYSIQLNDIAFLDEQTGFVAGEYGRVFRTSDGGGSWEDIQMPGPAYTLNSIFFIDNLKGWVCGEFGTIFHTSDGGLSWDQQASGDWDKDYQSVFFMNDQVGWVVGRIDFFSNTSGILKTENGGEDWILTDSFPGCWFLNSINFQDETIGYTAGFDGHLYKTEDGGENWFFHGSEQGFYTRSIVCNDDLLILCGGWSYDGHDGCDIITSTDFGNTWGQAMDKVINGDIWKIEAIDSLNAWIWSSYPDASLYRSTDGGLSWEANVSNYPYYIFNNLSFISVDEGWTIGRSSVLSTKVLKTTDGGDSWDTIASLPDAGQIWDLQFMSPEVGWFIDWESSQYNKVCRSSDGGVSWEVCLEQDVISLNTLYFLNEENGWVGATTNDGEGVLYNTSDGGLTWDSDTVAEKGIVSIVFSDINHGWFLTMDFVYYTVDGGVNWNESLVPGADWLTEIVFIDSQTGWCYDLNPDESSSAYVSHDGGISWTEDYTGASHYFYNMDFDTEGNGWMVGSFGQVLKRNHADAITAIIEPNKEIARHELTAFPNPFYAEITFKFPDIPAGKGRLEIYSLAGKRVFVKEWSGTTGPIDEFRWFPEGMKNGLYIAAYSTSGRVVTRKIVKLDL